MALLFAPVAQVRRLLAPRLARVSPFDYGNPLAEARSLNRAGYHAASVMLARIAVEKSLKNTVGAHPKWMGKRRRNFDEMMRFCHLQGVLSRDCYKLCRNFQKQANSVVHGNPVDRARAWFIIRRAAIVVSMLNGGAA